MKWLSGGERDYQVTHKDFDGWRAALGKQARVKMKLYPTLNHLFVAGTGRPSPEEYEAAGHVDVAVIEDVAAWIRSLPAAT